MNLQFVEGICYTVTMYKCIILPSLLEIPNFGMKYFLMSKVHTDESFIEYFNHGLSAYTGDNPLAKACGLSPRTGGQIVV